MIDNIKIVNKTTDLNNEIIGSVIDWYLQNQKGKKDISDTWYFNFEYNKKKYEMAIVYNSKYVTFCTTELK